MRSRCRPPNHCCRWYLSSANAGHWQWRHVVRLANSPNNAAECALLVARSTAFKAALGSGGFVAPSAGQKSRPASQAFRSSYPFDQPKTFRDLVGANPDPGLEFRVDDDGLCSVRPPVRSEVLFDLLLYDLSGRVFSATAMLVEDDDRLVVFDLAEAAVAEKRRCDSLDHAEGAAPPRR